LSAVLEGQGQESLRAIAATAVKADAVTYGGDHQRICGRSL